MKGHEEEKRAAAVNRNRILTTGTYFPPHEIGVTYHTNLKHNLEGVTGK